MKKFKEWLKPIQNFFLNSFSETFQMLLSKLLGDYLEDPQQLNLISIFQGIDKLQLNTKYINQLLGYNPFSLEDAYIQSLKIQNLNLEADKLTFILVLKDRSEEELNQFLQNLDEIQNREFAKLNYLQKLRKEIYQKNELEQVTDFSQATNSKSGLINFLTLADTLLSNSSIQIKNAHIILKFSQEVQYELHIHDIIAEFQKAKSSNLLFINFLINFIEFKFNKDQIAFIQNAIKLNMMFQTLENQKVQFKINGKVSSLDIVINKKQIKNILKSISNYRLKVDQRNKAIIKLQNQKIKTKKIFQATEFQQLEDDLSNSKELYSLSNYQSQEIFQSLYLSNDGNTTFNLNLVEQRETFKCFFQGLKLAVCENYNQFPQERGKFFEDLSSHFFIEIAEIITEYNQLQFNLNIKTIGAYRIKLNNPQIQIQNRSVNQSLYNSELFFTCNMIKKQDFLVTPVVILGQHQFKILETEFSIYNFEQMQYSNEIQNAVEINIQFLKCKNKQYFYQIKAKLSEIITSFRHESIINLLSYIPKTKVQQLPQMKKNVISLFGIELFIPNFRFNYLINDKTVTIKFKEIIIKQKPIQAIQLKIGQLEPFEEVQNFQNSKQLIVANFNQIAIDFEDQNIIKIDQQIINGIKYSPTIYLSFQETQQIQKEQFIQLESLINYKKQKSDTIMFYQIPTVEMQISENFLYWLISLNAYLQKFKQELKTYRSKITQKKSIKLFSQFDINQSRIRIYDNSLGDLFYLELQKINAVSAKLQLIQIYDIIAIDCQSQIPQKGDKLFKTFQSAQVMLYKILNDQNIIEQNIKKQQFQIQSNFMEIDYGKYVIQVFINQNLNIKIQNLCLRVPDFQFKSIKTFIPLFKYYQEIEDQIQQNQILTTQIIQVEKIMECKTILTLEKDLFFDIQPINVVEAFTKQNEIQNFTQYSNSRLILRINNLLVSSIIELNSVDIYINGQEQFPIILNGFFDNKPHILQSGFQLKISKAKYKDNFLIVEQIFGNFKYDTIQSIIQIMQDLSKIIPQSNKKASEELYMISKDFNQQLITQKIIDTIYELNVQQVSIELEQGVTFYDIDIIYDDTIDYQHQQNNEQDKICLNFTNCIIQVEIYQEGQIGLKYRSNFQIYDKINMSCFKYILSPDSEEFNIEDSSGLQLGLILENLTYTGFISLIPIRICISGSFLQFLFNFVSGNKQIYESINEDQIEIIQNVLPIIWLKKLQINQTSLNITYDSSGLKFDDLFKGLLKLGSFRNLQITIQNTEIQSKGNLDFVKQQILDSLYQNLGSKYLIAGKALNSLDALIKIKSLFQGITNLFLRKFEDIDLRRTHNDLQKSVSNVFKNVINGQEMLNNFKIYSLSSRFFNKQ